jgi:hypothetical protein
LRKFESSAGAIARLSPEQYGVTQHGDTERPGTGQLHQANRPQLRPGIARHDAWDAPYRTKCVQFTPTVIGASLNQVEGIK